MSAPIVSPFARPARQPVAAIEFKPLQVRKSVEPGRYFLEVGDERYYGGTALEAIGQAALCGAFGELKIELP